MVSIMDNRGGYFSFVAFSCLCFLALKAINHSPNWLREQEVQEKQQLKCTYSTLQVKPVKLWSLWCMTGESAHVICMFLAALLPCEFFFVPRHWGALQKLRRNRNTSSTARRTCCHAVKNDRCILVSCNSAPSWGSESLKEMGRQLKGTLPFGKHLHHEINVHITDTQLIQFASGSHFFHDHIFPPKGMFTTSDTGVSSTKHQSCRNRKAFLTPHSFSRCKGTKKQGQAMATKSTNVQNTPTF